MERLIKVSFNKLDPIAITTQLNSSPNRIVLIRDFPDNDFLLVDFIKKLGAPIKEERNLSSQHIFEVKVNKTNNLFQSFASSNHYFPLHTDCTDFDDVPNGLAMYCSKQSEVGGENFFTSIENIIDHLSDKELKYLQEKRWNFRGVMRPIINKIDATYFIYYNRIIMESYTNLSHKEKSFLDKFDRLIQSLSFTVKLKSSEMVILRNDKFLHGRNDFNEKSNRVIKRIRFQT